MQFNNNFRIKSFLLRGCLSLILISGLTVDFLEVLPKIEVAVRECDFLAIDAEFTGEIYSYKFE